MSYPENNHFESLPTNKYYFWSCTYYIQLYHSFKPLGHQVGKFLVALFKCYHMRGKLLGHTVTLKSTHVTLFWSNWKISWRETWEMSGNMWTMMSKLVIGHIVRINILNLSCVLRYMKYSHFDWREVKEAYYYGYFQTVSPLLVLV